MRLRVPGRGRDLRLPSAEHDRERPHRVHRREPSVVSADLTAEHITLDDEEIRERMSGNLCRCAAYANIVPAIMEVAQQAQEPMRTQQVGKEAHR
ncbi:MAG: hypothetical protein E6J36_03775 [Chloroflexi bacterium]|nr:MAG: hypothetical protein E6J36_03775 [Chloroflexota bacterium]